VGTLALIALLSSPGAAVAAVRPAHFVSISPTDLEADLEATELVAAALDSALGDRVSGHLGPIHVGLLCLLNDLGGLPTPEALRSSRDIRTIVHSLGDLETLGVVGRRGERLVLTDASRAGLRCGLKTFWARRAARAEVAMADAPRSEATRPRETVQRWLRNLVVLVAHHGLRLNQAGELHAGDLRRWQKLAELPSRRFLETTVSIGRGAHVLWALEDRLLVGESVDLLDMDSRTFTSTILADLAAGSVDLGHGHVTALGGALARQVTAIGPAVAARDDLPHLLGPVSPDPLSDFLPPADPATLAAATAAFAATHQRLRTGLIGLIGHLPTGVSLPMNAVSTLVHAHLAAELLRHPCRNPSEPHGAPVMMASACHVLPFAAERVAEHLAAWIEEVWTPLGAAEVRRDSGLTALVLHDPQPDLLGAGEGAWTVELPRDLPAPAALHPAGHIFVQPSGEVMAPPSVSIHGLIHLAQGADPARFDDLVTFNLTRRSLMRVLHSGLDVLAWGEAVAAMSSLPMPQTVRSLIDETAARQGELVVAPAGGVIVATEALRLDELLSHKRFADVVVLRPAPTVAILAPGVDLAELLDAINARGFGGVGVERIGG